MLARGIVGPVFAMARPRRPDSERELVEQAADEIGAIGSRRARAGAVAARVAALVVGQLALTDIEAMVARAGAVFETPALASLAFGEDSAAGTIVQSEATSAFQRRGCRHAKQGEWRALDDALRDMTAARLAERYRRA